MITLKPFHIFYISFLFCIHFRRMMLIPSKFVVLLLLSFSAFVLSSERSDNDRRLGTAGDVPNEESCGRDEDCDSGFCSKDRWCCFWRDGVCNECRTDKDCGASLRRDSLSKAYCVDIGNEQKVCSAWKHGKPIDEKGYPLHSLSINNKEEDENPIDWIRRYIHDKDLVSDSNNNEETNNKEPVMSQVWRWDLNNQPEGASLEANETHVRIPLNTPFHAGYSRTYHAFDNEHETGIVTLILVSNEYSIMMENAHSMMVEKYHTLTYTNDFGDDLPTPKASHIEKELVNRPKTKHGMAEAEKKLKKRSLAQAAAIMPTRVADSLMEAGQDLLHLENLRKYLRGRRQDEEGATDEYYSDLWLDNDNNKMSEEAKDALEYAKTEKSMKSENHCKHFEDYHGIGITETDLEIPLNKPWLAHSGETNLSPSYIFGYNNGIMIAKYDNEKNILEIHYKAYQQYRYHADAGYERPPSGLWLAPISLEYPVMDQDGRSDRFYQEHSWYNEMLNKYRSIPVDYSVYDRTETCDDETRDELADLWDDLDYIEIINESQSTFGDLMDFAGFTRILINGITCASSLMRPDYGPNTVGFEVLEMLVVVHFIIEIDPNFTESLLTSPFWNEWDDFYKKQ